MVRTIRPQDIVLLALLAALAVASPTLDASEIAVLLALGVLQVAEPRIQFLGTRRGKLLWISLQLIFAYLLIGLTGALNSQYYLILLLPVISAATYLGLAWT